MSIGQGQATAVWFSGVRQVELREEKLPALDEGQIRVASICSLISPGSEMNLYRGEGNLPGSPAPHRCRDASLPDQDRLQRRG